LIVKASPLSKTSTFPHGNDGYSGSQGLFTRNHLNMEVETQGLCDPTQGVEIWTNTTSLKTGDCRLLASDELGQLSLRQSCLFS